MIQDIAFSVTRPVTGKEMEWKDLVSDPLTSADWTLSTSNELGRMAQGAGKMLTARREQKEPTRYFSSHPTKSQRAAKSPIYKKVCTYRPQKAEQNRTRFTAMGNFITDYTGQIITKTAGLELIKMYWNSVLSTKKAKYMTMDISNMYLNTPLNRIDLNICV